MGKVIYRRPVPPGSIVGVDGRMVSASGLTALATVPGESGLTTLATARWTNGLGTSVEAWTDGVPSRNYWCNTTAVAPTVFSAESEGWPGPGNVFSLATSTGCGGFLLDRVFPQPVAGAMWTWRFYFKQNSLQTTSHGHGFGDLNPVGAIDRIFLQVGHQGGGAFGYRMGSRPGRFGWNALNNYNGVRGVYNTTFFHWGNEIQFAANTWYEFSFRHEWLDVSGPPNTWSYRDYPEIRDMAGNLIVDYRNLASDEVEEPFPSGFITLPDFYANGGYFLRSINATTSDTISSSIRNYYHGVAQSQIPNSGRIYYAGLDVGVTDGPRFPSLVY